MAKQTSDSVEFSWAKDDKGQVHYAHYLQLDQVLQAQKVTSQNYDEHFFVVVHQVYELWFKQIRREIDLICNEFQKGKEANLLTIILHLDRTIKIQKLLVEQIRLIETICPQDFYDFINNVRPASGFQSYQFRILECRLGFNEKARAPFKGDKEGYINFLTDKEREEVLAEKKKESLFVCVEKWLNGFPELDENDFNFPAKYEQAVLAMVQPFEDANKQDKNEEGVKAIEMMKGKFYSLIKKEEHDEMVEKGRRRFNQRALLAAVMITLYRDDPRFHMPYQILTHLIEVDNLLMKWRLSHVSVVQYQIGNMGDTDKLTAVPYLQKTISNDPRFFADLISVSSLTYTIGPDQLYFIKEYIPKLS